MFSIYGGSTGSSSQIKSFSSSSSGGVGSEVEFEEQPSNNTDLCNTLGFEVVGESLVYDGWRKVVRKEIIMPNKRNVMFDVVTQKSPSVTVFVWDRETATATLVQEYHPGVEKMMYGAVAGMFEGHKHDTLLDCAKSELEEEAQLSSENWISLLGDASTSAPFEKYSDNMIFPFLVLDCEPVLNPKPLDDEEYIIIHKGVSHARLMEMISAGELNIISSYTVLMGIKKLVEMGIPLSKD